MKCEYYNWKQRGGLRKGSDQKQLYARMANISYQDGLDARQKQLDKYGLSEEGWKIDPSLTNDDMATIYNDRSKEIVFSVAGTRLDKKHARKDLFSDLGIITGTDVLGKRTSQVNSVVKKGQLKYKGYEPVLAAHSLGAKVSKTVSGKTGIPTILAQARPQ